MTRVVTRGFATERFGAAAPGLSASFVVTRSASGRLKKHHPMASEDPAFCWVCERHPQGFTGCRLTPLVPLHWYGRLYVYLRLVPIASWHVLFCCPTSSLFFTFTVLAKAFWACQDAHDIGSILERVGAHLWTGCCPVSLQIEL